LRGDGDVEGDLQHLGVVGQSAGGGGERGVSGRRQPRHLAAELVEGVGQGRAGLGPGGREGPGAVAVLVE
ncbi:hypothetical protein ACFVYE_47150, partial [Streptomyces sp. NPDC058239]|uniref:hypothetical protein n=1 Tax=Streptomyces sp. NPDC058239 TaxID=3346395 RepID=UPI0036E99EEC